MSVSEFSIVACRLVLYGHVQGVGLRPAMARLASDLGLSGHVRNVAEGVEIHLEGSASQIETFRHRMHVSLPAESHVTSSHCEASDPVDMDRFEILESRLDGPLTTRVPADRAVCAACLGDVAAENNRRFKYAFTSCTACGPRYSLMEAMPYDRLRTGMREFVECRCCTNEYSDRGDRRFHAQTIACPSCGPKLSLAPKTGADADPLDVAVAALLKGKILAVRGLGGYQLIVDATNSAAVEKLRRNKRRRAKPFAVMVKSIEDVQRLVDLTPCERSWLVSAENPIILVRLRTPNVLCGEIQPGLRDVGLFLPTTPMHWLLLDRVQRPLVVTSGNIEGEPIAVEPLSAERHLENVADLWIHHDREIPRPTDDSVLRVIGNRPVTIRNARGLAPLPLPNIEKFVARTFRQTGNLPCVLAVGGHQKNALALFNGAQAVLGPHIGDLESLATRQRFIEQLNQFQKLYGCHVDTVVHDSHPDYFTTLWASSSGLTTLAVQHHHAHVVSAMVENDWLDRTVLGVALDGTGFGSDGTIWGGEFLRATVCGFERVAHLRPFPLPGGEVAVHQPWRVAAALLIDSVGRDAARYALERYMVAHDRISPIFKIIESGRIGPVTSSAGRLFDGVASLLLGISNAEFEGHPAMLLESAADAAIAEGYDFPYINSSPGQLDWRPMIRQLLADRRRGCSTSMMAAKFHRGLARGIAAVCRTFDLPIVLTGGVFQNRLLTEWTVEESQDFGLELGLHSRIPPNDGGLAAGQLAIALGSLAAGVIERRANIGGI